MKPDEIKQSIVWLDEDRAKTSLSWGMVWDVKIVPLAHYNTEKEVNFV